VRSPLRATDGKCPVQRLKAWLEEADSLCPRQTARLDPVYPRLGGQVREPSAHGTSEVRRRSHEAKSTSRSGRMMSAPNGPARRGLHICDAWRRRAVSVISCRSRAPQPPLAA
jgi:hypothetical protein